MAKEMFLQMCPPWQWKSVTRMGSSQSIVEAEKHLWSNITSKHDE